jgi:hypothetical protein
MLSRIDSSGYNAQSIDCSGYNAQITHIVICAGKCAQITLVAINCAGSRVQLQICNSAGNPALDTEYSGTPQLVRW